MQTQHRAYLDQGSKTFRVKAHKISQILCHIKREVNNDYDICFIIIYLLMEVNKQSRFNKKFITLSPHKMLSLKQRIL